MFKMGAVAVALSTWRMKFLIAAGLLMACQTAVDQKAAGQALLDADKAFAQASMDHGAAEAFNRFLSDDALQLPDGKSPVNGRDAIVGGLGGNYTLSWEPQRAEVAESGELGWTWGTYVFEAPRDDGGNSVSHGKYLNIWRRTDGGDWQVIVDMGNQSPEP